MLEKTNHAGKTFANGENKVDGENRASVVNPTLLSLLPSVPRRSAVRLFLEPWPAMASVCGQNLLFQCHAAEQA
jgi:hypothetical protein